jgi:hypothetical protein
VKTAVYFEDETAQVVLTPESDFEKQLLQRLDRKDLRAMIYRGSFYECRGGWTRNNYREGLISTDGSDASLMIRIERERAEP